MQIIDELGCVLCDVQPSNGRLFLGRAMLRRAQLQNCDLRGAVLSCADLRGANLDGADLSGALLDDADLTGASLKGTQLAGVNLLRARLVEAQLSHVDLSTAILKSDSYTDCPTLTGATIEWSNLSGHWIKGDFSHASFRWSDLSRCSLVGSLTWVRFEGARLDQACFCSDLCYTDFRRTDLSRIGQIFGTGPRRTKVQWDQETKWPPAPGGYLVAFQLMTWEELHPFLIALFAMGLPLVLAMKGVLRSPTVIAFWIGVLACTAVALRVVYVRHRKRPWP